VPARTPTATGGADEQRHEAGKRNLHRGPRCSPGPIRQRADSEEASRQFGSVGNSLSAIDEGRRHAAATTVAIDDETMQRNQPASYQPRRSAQLSSPSPSPYCTSSVALCLCSNVRVFLILLLLCVNL
jgi:hypothetical protein